MLISQSLMQQRSQPPQAKEESFIVKEREGSDGPRLEAAGMEGEEQKWVTISGVSYVIGQGTQLTLQLVLNLKQGQKRRKLLVVNQGLAILCKRINRSCRFASWMATRNSDGASCRSHESGWLPELVAGDQGLGSWAARCKLWLRVPVLTRGLVIVLFYSQALRAHDGPCHLGGTLERGVGRENSRAEEQPFWRVQTLDRF